jgi:hypothetical protein
LAVDSLLLNSFTPEIALLGLSSDVLATTVVMTTLCSSNSTYALPFALFELLPEVLAIGLSTTYIALFFPNFDMLAIC